MSGVAYDYIENYIRKLIPESDDFLKEMESFAEENRVPIAQKDTAQFLSAMIRIIRPKKILELGTAIGYSAIVMNNSYNKAEITTIERDEKMVKLARENIEKLNLSDKIKVIEGDVLLVVKELNEKYDVIFIDAGKGHYNHLLDDLLNLLNEDGVIIADNVLFRGMVASDELVIRRKITIVKRMRKYLDMVSTDPKLFTTVIPMGDGIAITTRRNINE